MYKILKADKDAYITNRVVKGRRAVDANTGAAGTLDIFKLYGATRSGSTPNIELSRAVIHFDLTPLSALVEAGEVDTSDPSFWCRLQLTDVYGGQPVPSNFTLDVFPLSASFQEGYGKDISYYADSDAANWLSSSIGILWNAAGAGVSGTELSTCDYITSSTSIPSTQLQQNFTTGTENLSIDVTKIVSATLSGEIPDEGFRISLQSGLEADTNTYFVKRFASRHAYDETKRPKLVFGYDDSVYDDTQILTFDTTCRIRLYNSVAGRLTNLAFGGAELTGSNCLILRLDALVSGSPNFSFTGSQDFSGTKYASGSYYADVQLSSTGSLAAFITQSGSIKFNPVWTSLNGAVTYTTGSSVTFTPQSRSTSSGILQKYIVSVNGVKKDYRVDETILAQVNIFDQSSPLLKMVKVPVEHPGIVIPDSYYRIRDVILDEVVVPFDDIKNSTRLSSDSTGMYFRQDADTLTPGRTYVIDIMVKSMGMTRVFESASPVFRIERSPTG